MTGGKNAMDREESETAGVGTAPTELFELARTLGRAAADASHRMGVELDLDNLEVARELMAITFDAVVLGRSSPVGSRRSRG